jgi:preprotein translocase subunit SecF
MPTTWDIVGRRRWGYLLSVLLIIPGLVALIAGIASGRGALNWGVDFTGGNYFQLRLERDFSVGDVRTVVDRFASGESIIQRADQDAIVRTRPMNAETSSKLLAAMRQRFGKVTVMREDSVGPKIGQELRSIALLAVILGLALQVIYIWYRFKSIRYAVTADLALLHDLVIVTGLFALTRKEVNSSFVAILLTVVGYSINDTIVVYDRIRENLAQRTKEPFDRLVNRSMLEVLVRSLMTGISAILAIAAIWIFGGVTIQDFAFGLGAGIVLGTYSSIFNASALLVDWHLFAQRRAGRAETETMSRPAALATESASAGMASRGEGSRQSPSLEAPPREAPREAPTREARGRAAAKRRRNKRR